MHCAALQGLRPAPTANTCDGKFSWVTFGPPIAEKRGLPPSSRKHNFDTEQAAKRKQERAARQPKAQGKPQQQRQQQQQQQAPVRPEQQQLDPARRLRAVRKKLRQIDALAEVAAGGQTLSDEEAAKLAAREGLEREAAALEAALAVT